MIRKYIASFVISLFLIQLCGSAFTSDNNIETKGTIVSGIIDTDTTWDLLGSPYRVRGNIEVSVNVELTIEAGVTVLFDGFYSLDVKGNLTAIGTNTSMIVFTSNATVHQPSDWNRIHIYPTGHLEMEYCEVTYGHRGIHILLSQGNSIRKSFIKSNTIGIYLETSDNNEIFQNTMLSNYQDGIYLSRSSFNNIYSNNINHSSIYRGIDMKWSHNNIIENNTLDWNGHGIYMYSSNGNSIVGNTVSRNVGYNGISMEESYTNYVSNNTATYSNNQGIWMQTSSYNTINNNTLTNSDYNGIYLSSGTHNVIVDNTATGSNDFHGISIDGADGNLIANNLVRWNNINGIYLLGQENIVRENVVENNAQEGILIMGLNNYVVRNSISSNLEGIGIESGTGHMIAYNNITSNSDLGLTNSLTSGNSIIGNNFELNAPFHAYDSMPDIWNDSCGGNYWDDWTGPDADMNGIVDVPRDISGGVNKDFLPLTTPSVYKLPSPPTNLSVKLEGSSFEHVNISWDLSTDENLCSDRVKNYSIYYSSTYDSDGKDYQSLAEVPKGTNYYVHSNGGKGDPNSYFYTVQANDTFAFKGRNETQVAKFNRDLDAGMHLISIPLILENNSISSALQTLDFDVAWYYNSSDTLDPWKSYNKLKPVNDLTTVNRTMALWVDVLSDGNFTVAGTVPDSTDISLQAGWNLIGYPSFIEKNVSEALNAITYERVEGYCQTPPQFLRIHHDDDNMKPGFGYWIKVQTSGTQTFYN